MKLKKKNLGVLLLTFCLSTFAIQTASSQVRLGVRGGVDIISNDINTKMLNVDNQSGYKIGASLDIGLPIIGLGIETGAQYGSQKYKTPHQPEDYKDVEIKDYNYITVPLLLKQKFTIIDMIGIYIKGGAYANITTKDAEVMWDNKEYKSDSFQAGWTAGAGVILFKKIEFGMDYRQRFEKSAYSDLPVDFNKVGKDAWSATLAFYF